MKTTRIALLAMLLMAGLNSIAAVRTAPDPAMLPGTWHYATVRIVADAMPDNAAQLELRIDELLQLSTVNAESCLLKFIDDKHCSFGVGSRTFRLTWKLDPADCAFNAAYGWFKVKGQLYTADKNLCLLYSPSTLLMMMRFMCPLSAKKNIDEIEDILSSHPGMQLAVEFKK